MHRSGSKLRLLRSGQKNTPPADARQSPGPRTPNPSSPLFPEPLGADPPTEQPSRSSGEREESPEEGETPHGGALSVWSDSPPSELSPVTTPTVATPQLLVNADAWGVSPTIPDVSFPLTGETASPTTGTASAPSFDKADSPRAKADPKSLYYEFFVVNLQGQTLKGIEALATQACAQVLRTQSPRSPSRICPASPHELLYEPPLIRCLLPPAPPHFLILPPPPPVCPSLAFLVTGGGKLSGGGFRGENYAVKKSGEISPRRNVRGV